MSRYALVQLAEDGTDKPVLVNIAHIVWAERIGTTQKVLLTLSTGKTLKVTQTIKDLWVMCNDSPFTNR